MKLCLFLDGFGEHFVLVAPGCNSSGQDCLKYLWLLVSMACAVGIPMAVACIDGLWKKLLPALGWGSAIDDLAVHSLDLIVIVLLSLSVLTPTPPPGLRE